MASQLNKMEKKFGDGTATTAINYTAFALV